MYTCIYNVMYVVTHVHSLMHQTLLHCIRKKEKGSGEWRNFRLSQIRYYVASNEITGKWSHDTVVVFNNNRVLLRL